MSFTNASIETGVKTAIALNGTLTVRAALGLVDRGASGKKMPAVDFGLASVMLSFDQPSIQEWMATFGVVDLTQVEQSLGHFFQVFGIQTLPLGFHVASGVDGRISSALQFER